MMNSYKYCHNIYNKVVYYAKNTITKRNGGYVAGFSIYPFAVNSIDVNYIEKKDYLLKKEVGWNGVKQMLQTDRYGYHSPEMAMVYETGLISFMSGIVYGGISHSRNAYVKFIENNQATKYENMFDAQSDLNNKMMMAIFRGGLRYGWRLCVLCTGLMFFSNVISVYTGEHTLVAYTGAGFICGCLYKFKEGPRPMIVSGVLYGVMGTLFGLTLTGLLKISGLTKDDLVDAKIAAFEQDKQARELRKQIRGEDMHLLKSYKEKLDDPNEPTLSISDDPKDKTKIDTSTHTANHSNT